MLDLYSGPWRGPSNQSGAAPYSGPAAIALKRIVSRARPDLFTWRAFDDHYNRRLERAIAEIQRTHGITATGQTGEPTFRLLMSLKRAGHPHELAADNVAINLLEDAWAKLHPPVTPLHKVQEQIRAYWITAFTYNAIWHYYQLRAMTTLGRAPWRGGRSDCSEMATAAPYYARVQTGVMVPDPNDRGFDGYGNTDTLYAVNRHRTVTNGRYEVGDLGIFGPAYRTRHVIECYRAGDANTAEWGSNGSEAGPLPVRLHYRGDLLAVVRPRLIP